MTPKFKVGDYITLDCYNVDKLEIYQIIKIHDYSYETVHFGHIIFSTSTIISDHIGYGRSDTYHVKVPFRDQNGIRLLAADAINKLLKQLVFS